MRIILCSIFYLLTSNFLLSQSGIKISKWISGIAVPVDIGHCGDERLFVVEKAGKIRIIENDQLLVDPFLDIRAKVRATGGEQGLLGVAFHPDYLTNGLFFVNYTDRANPTKTVIEKYQVSSDKSKADSLSGQIILSFIQPYANHNGGGLIFGPDGYLYIATGDGGSANDPQNFSQNNQSMLGKMLRIDVDTIIGYKIPKSNPFINNVNYLKEIWSTGLRNPWRYSFDKETGDLWIGDVGQGNWEEIDFEPANSTGGLNYGWRCYEGNANFNLAGCNAKSSYTFPIHEYFSDENINGCSVTGGFVYRGKKYPSLYGKYIYGDYCSGKIWALKRNNDGTYTNNLVYDHTNNVLTTFGQDAAGELYFADVNMSSIYKISDTCNFNFNVITINPSCPGLSNGEAKTSLPDGVQAQFIWSNGDTTAEARNLSPGIYEVSVIYNQCKTIKTFEIFEKQSDTACIQKPAVTEICASDSLLLNSCNVTGAQDYQWYKNGLKLENEISDKIWIRESGNYQLRYTDSVGCESLASESVDILVFPLPETPEILIRKDTLEATSGYLNYRWYWNEQVIGTTTENQIIAILEGNYRVEVIDSNQCVSERSGVVIYTIVSSKDVLGSENSFDLMPNPVSDYLVIYSKQNITLGRLNYQIISAQNTVVVDGQIERFKDSSRIDVTQLSPGMYWIKIENSKRTSKLSFIKMK